MTGSFSSLSCLSISQTYRIGADCILAQALVARHVGNKAIIDEE
jgi:hypothetical protein